MTRYLLAATICLSVGCTENQCSGEEDECEPQLTFRKCRGESIPFYQFDAEHCGFDDGCIVCPNPQIPNAVAACVNQTQCAWGCASSRADCNGDASDGCEVSLSDDVNNCGACGARCHGACASAVCAAQFDGEAVITAVIGDDPPVTGGGAPHVQHLLWTRSDGGTLDIRQASLDGTEPVTLASVPAASGSASLLLSDGWLYWTTGSTLQPGGGGAVYRMPFTALPSQPVLVASEQDGPSNILVYDGGIFWTNSGAGQVMRSDLDGGAPLVLASGQSRPGSLAADGEQLFWVNQGFDGGDGSVMALALDGGTPTVISTDSTLVDGTSSATAGAPTAITVLTVPPYDRQAAWPRLVIWADLPSRTIWGWTGSTTLALTYLVSGPWNPVQLFGGSEHFSLFNEATRTFFDTGLFIPGSGRPYGGPFGLESDPDSRWPANTRLISPTPLPGTWTDGSSVGSSFCIQESCSH